MYPKKRPGMAIKAGSDSSSSATSTDSETKTKPNYPPFEINMTKSQPDSLPKIYELKTNPVSSSLEINVPTKSDSSPLEKHTAETKPSLSPLEMDTVRTKPTSSRFVMDRALTNPHIVHTEPSGLLTQEHGRVRSMKSEGRSVASMTQSAVSLAHSISKFRCDFDDMKCKMVIFGESLNICKCMANDFNTKLRNMEFRLDKLERRHMDSKSESNYTAIIQKNKRLSNKTRAEAKKLQMCGTEEEMRDVAASICRNYLPGAWKTVEPKQLNFRRISGGLSNFLYYVSLPDDIPKVRYTRRDSEHDTDVDEGKMLSKSVTRTDSFIIDEPRQVLLRIYGQVHGERAMDAIVTESVIFTLLSERRLGPKLHGVFSGGRIEQYIPSRALLTKELSEPALSMKIAEKMAAIHSMDVPLSKEPNWLWKTMGKWIKTAKTERLNGNVAAAKNEDEEKIIKRLQTVDFEKEMEWLKKYISTVESPVVFCHNDMQEGNILLLEDVPTQTPDDEYTYTFDIQTNKHTKDFTPEDDANTSDSISSHISDIGEPKLSLIDFEYCAYNYRGFDIANHFQEWMYDYTNPEHPFYYENEENLPTLEQKEIFIKEYLKHFLNNQERNVEPSIDEVNHLLHEVEAFALASHLFWTMWSVVNASKSQIPFGYWEYTISRLEMYLKLKQEVIKKEKFGLPLKRKIEEVDI